MHRADLCWPNNCTCITRPTYVVGLQGGPRNEPRQGAAVLDLWALGTPEHLQTQHSLLLGSHPTFCFPGALPSLAAYSSCFPCHSASLSEASYVFLFVVLKML